MTATITPTQEAEFLAAFPALVARRREATLVKIFDRFPSLVSLRAGADQGATVFQTLVNHRLTFTAHHCLFAGHLGPRVAPAPQPDELTACAFAAPDTLWHHLFSTFLHVQDGAFIAPSAAYLADNQGMIGQLIQRSQQSPASYATALSLLDAFPAGSLRPKGQPPQPVVDALVQAIIALPADTDPLGATKTLELINIFKAAHTAGVDFNCLSIANRFSPISAACFRGNETLIKSLINSCEAKMDPIYFDGKPYSEALKERPELVSMITNELIKVATAAPKPDAAPSAHMNKQRTRRAV